MEAKRSLAISLDQFDPDRNQENAFVAFDRMTSNCHECGTGYLEGNIDGAAVRLFPKLSSEFDDRFPFENCFPRLVLYSGNVDNFITFFRQLECECAAVPDANNLYQKELNAKLEDSGYVSNVETLKHEYNTKPFQG